MKKNFNKRIENTLSIIGQKSYIEVRILKVANKGTLSGYYNDYKKLADDISEYDGKVNIFFTINPVINSVTSRAVNRLNAYSAHTTTDMEIEKIKWILIDIDAERPAGVSSTDEELSYAKEVWEQVIQYLLCNGFSEGIRAMSGNGYHYLIPVEMPNNEKSTKMIKTLLQMLHCLFSNEKAKIDVTTYNASRICKLYGTIACKGDNTKERPHRRSKILSVPKEICPTSEYVIENLLHLNKTDEVDGSVLDFNLNEWLSKHGIEVVRKKDWENGTCYVLAECPWGNGHDHDTGAYIIQFKNGYIVAGCHHAKCEKENWMTLWKKYEGNRKFGSNQKKDEKKEKERINPADRLVNHIEDEGHEFFCDRQGNAYVMVSIKGTIYNYKVQSEEYKHLLQKQYYLKYHSTLSREWY